MKTEAGLILTGIRIVVRIAEMEEKTSGGIVLPKSTQEKEMKAQTSSILIDGGDDAWDVPEMKGIERGDRIFFARYAGAGCEYYRNGVMYRVMNATDVIGRVEADFDSQFKAAEPAPIVKFDEAA